MMAEVPKITLTMLGPSRSGKTTYLLGMYSTLSGGLEGYFLHASDYDLDLQLANDWDALLEDGLLPKPTADVPKSYPLVFKDGLFPLVAIDWLDYRGGAIHDKSSEADVQTLLARLKTSDSIYLTLDGAFLTEAIDDYNYQAAMRTTKANRMTMLLSRTLQDRADRPSIVVLVTKEDLFRSRLRSASNPMDKLVEDVQRLLPICFEQELTTMICPVGVGQIGYSKDGRVDPSLVSPVFTHKPILFSLLLFLASLDEYWEQRSAELEAQISHNATQLQSIQSSRRKKLLSRSTSRELTDSISRYLSEREGVSQERQAIGYRVARLREELGDVPIFVGGKRV
jgi:hypothetical protein